MSSLIALSAGRAVLGEDFIDRLEGVVPEIQHASETRWTRPNKTQSAEQWRYTAGVVGEMLEILKIDPT